MVVGIMILLFFVISWMIAHFGRNPVRGGSPPRDSIVVKISIVISGSLFHEWDSEVVVVAELSISSINIVMVIGIYR